MNLDTIARGHVEALREATAAVQIPTRAARRGHHGLVVAIAAAVLALVAIGVAGIMRDTSAPAASTSPPSTVTSAPATTAAPLSTPDAQWPSFEMTFEIGDGTFGRFLWMGPDRWLVERRRWSADGLSEQIYAAARRGTDATLSDPAEMFGPVRSDRVAPSEWEYVPDPEIPLDLLMVPGQAAALSPAEESPLTHPWAQVAVIGERATVEMTAEGIPVLIRPRQQSEFELTVTQLDIRPIGATEIAPQIVGDFQLIEFLSAGTTDEQAAVLAKGFVSAEDYRQAVEATVSCVEAADPDAPVSVDGDPGRGPVEVLTPSPALATCEAAHLDQVGRLWGYQTVALDPVDVERLYYEATGDIDALAVLDGTPGEQVAFPDLAIGLVEAYVQGPGICSRIELAGSEGRGCVPTSAWQVPDTLAFGVSYGWDGESLEVSTVGLEGFAPLTAVELQVTLTTGESIRVRTAQPSGDFPFSAFTYAYDGGRLGFPVEVRVLDSGGEELTVFDFRAYHCDPDSAWPKDGPMATALCDAG